MKTTLLGRQLYRVSGASSRTGEDVEITVEAFDEADAARAANRQGVFVSGCVADASTGNDWAGSVQPARPPTTVPAAVPSAAASGPTFAEVVAADPVVRKLMLSHPQLGRRCERLNAEDRQFLSDLASQRMGLVTAIRRTWAH